MTADSAAPLKIAPLALFSLQQYGVHAGKQLPGPDGIAITTIPQQWAYAVSFPPLTAPPSREGFILIRVAGWTAAGSIGLGLLVPDGSKFIREVFVTVQDGPSILEFAVDAASDFGPLVIRNAAPGETASQFILESIAAHQISGKGAGQLDVVGRAIAAIGIAEMATQGVMAASLEAESPTPSAATPDDVTLDFGDRDFFGAGDDLETVMKALAHCDHLLNADRANSTALGAKAKILLQLDRVSDLAEIGSLLVAAGHPQLSPLLKHILIRLRNAIRPPDCFNIGGGPWFHCAGWINLDAVAGPLNPHPFALSDTMTFPFPNGTKRVAYSSHCIEHLDDATVDRAFEECKRVLRPDGFLVLKIPDFEAALAAWRKRDQSFFEGWGIEDVIPTWPAKGVEPSLSARAGMIFCGFWNDEYGDRNATFSRHVSGGASAYHGPPKLSEAEWSELFTRHSPHGIAAALRARVIERERGFHFNHQNAWSAGELSALLARHGFTVLSTDRETICRRLGEIPNLRQSFEQSLYCLAASS